ncbi:hypothetical protein DFH11DRAFT_1522179 [Phellopilus nigrolimitatus]|nr:hypothetical protein DFH11DRAFT_1522179 [Phellopilus nigrolimitatus]
MEAGGTPTKRKKAIGEITCKDKLVFNGFGKHMSSDVFHLCLLYSATLIGLICSDSKLFEHFCSTLVSYSATWELEKFICFATGFVNLTNTFSYNTTSWKNYSTSSFLKVY